MTGNFVTSTPRIGIIAHRFLCPGGIQTCFVELIAGLNDIGITPEVLWDEPTDWEALCNPEVSAKFGGGWFPFNSSHLRSFPSRFSTRLKPVNLRLADFRLNRYDFVYSFEPGVNMKPGTKNLCYTVGPPYVLTPDQDNFSRQGKSQAIRRMLSKLTIPAMRPDKYSRYVTLSDWIADLFLKDHGFRPPVIWPPTRTRKFEAPRQEAPGSGFLFLSRLNSYKNPGIMLLLAESFPDRPVTIAGSTIGDPEAQKHVTSLQLEINKKCLANVSIIENPSDEQIARLLETHAFFVFAAPWEHFGIVTVEAIQAGLIPLVHDSGGQREIVPFDFLRFTEDGELVERADAVIRMSPGRRKELREALSKHVRRGSSESYRAAMLSYLRQDLGID
jgi:glycosyltransferase involved in cell wall biosynthesis